MSTIPENFSVKIGHAEIEITQVDRIDPGLAGQADSEAAVPGLFLPQSQEILLCRRLPEGLKQTALAQCLDQASKVYSSAERAGEKAQARREDAEALAQGKISPAELREQNAHFALKGRIKNKK